MPDHVHVLAIGLGERSNTVNTFVRWKQATGYWYRQRTREYLWQAGFWERVLREEDDIAEAVQYIVANPIRAGLVEDLREYQWIGASRWTVEELAIVCQDAVKPRWWDGGPVRRG